MTASGATFGLAADRLVGEPPIAWHPVARYGSLMEQVEHRLYADRRANGVVQLACGVALAALAGRVADRVLGRTVATAVAVAVCAAGRMLDDEAAAMATLLGDRPANPATGTTTAARTERVEQARARVRSLVGRDAAQLGPDELARAVVESVAENCVDAVTATLWWGTIGGATGALVHRAVNTLDAMIGHRNARYERYGWAAARLDDALNYVPARLTAVAVAAVRPRRARAVWRAVRDDAPRHPSPNGGVVEAAFAAALGVTLGGVNRYDDQLDDRGTLGTGPPPTVGHVVQATRLRRDATLALAAALLTAQARGRRRS